MLAGGIILLLKKLLTGVLTIAMFTGVVSTDLKAVGAADYQAYAAELDQMAYDKDDLGATYTKDATTFKVWSPKADDMSVDIYDDGGSGKSIKTKKMTLNRSTGVWEATIPGNLAGKYYTYTVRHGKSTKVTGDIYARACGVNGKRSMVIDLDTTDPQGWENDQHVYVAHQTNATVWEISVADFSSSKSSGVSAKNRGKFTAFTEKDTTVDGIQGAPSTCVDYLKKLGVKYVQIMPMYDFGSVDESKDIMKQYNWGYDPINYNIPEGSYSTDPDNGSVRINECKQMIQALHNSGIGVIMDVVYNHTYSTDSWFQYTVPNYYYRMNPDGSFSNGSGCGNDTASEHLMFRKYMIDSVLYWASEYHIDGFRFDLMGLHDVTTMNQIREALDNLYDDGSGKRILMYGEAWNLDTNCAPGTVMANQNNLSQLDNRIGAFNDTIRDAIKGSVFGNEPGFVQTGKNRSGIKKGFLGMSVNGWASVPTQCVNYASCHDNEALYDKLVDSVLSNKEYRKRHEELVSMNKLSAAIVFTSQGIPFILGGEEFARSKDGDENSYASSRTENQLDWKNLNEYSDLIEYYRGLLKIRETFTALSDPTTMTADSIVALEDLPKSVCAYTVDNTEAEGWQKACMVFNGSDDEQNVSISGEWIKIADDMTAGLKNLGTCSGSVKVKAHSAAILIDKTSYEKSVIEDFEGTVVINYYDNETKKKIKTQVITDRVGGSYDITSIATSLNYDIKSSSGDTAGSFTPEVKYADVYVEEYKGKMSNVTIKFVDEKTKKELADDYVIRNREGKKYYTPELPEIDGYSLMMDKLPKNGAGDVHGDEITVTYYYKKTDSKDKDVCRLNLVYMADNGKILDKKTLTGKEGQEYSAQQNEYEDMNLIAVPNNSFGVFKKGDTNVLFRYSTQPDPFADLLIYVYIGAGVIMALCVVSAIMSRVNRKKKLRAAMEFSSEPQAKTEYK